MKQLFACFVFAVLLALALARCGANDCPIQCVDGSCSHASNTQGACSSLGRIASVNQTAGHSPLSPSPTVK